MIDALRGLPHSRRRFLEGTGSLIVAFSIRGVAGAAQTPLVRGNRAGPPDPSLIDTWIAINKDNTATLYMGFVELGQGAPTGLLQVAAEELDLDIDQMSYVQVDTNVTPNQGGTSASASSWRGTPQVRQAAAEARFALLKLAGERLKVGFAELTVTRGVVAVAGRPGRSVRYGDLLGDRPFNISFTGTAPHKAASQYRIVGTRVPRVDMPAKVSGSCVYIQHVRLPGMLHGRIVRPRGQGAYAAGARVLSIDENSIRHIPDVQIVRKRDFVGVVAASEWNAVRAARELAVTWETPASLPGHAALHDQMRAAQTDDTVVTDTGNVDAALSAAAHVSSATYRTPYQAHAPFAPGCAVAHVTSKDALLMCSSQGLYGTRDGIAAVLGLPAASVRVQYYEGSGTYGRSCYNDVAQAAAFMSQAIAKPVRVQFMRWDEHGWDNYGTAHLADVRAGVDAAGKIVAFEYQAWQHGTSRFETSQQLALGTAAQEAGFGSASVTIRTTQNSMYDVPNRRMINHRVPGVTGVDGYLKTSNLRSPLDLSVMFAAEQAIDELAFLARLDPLEFRRRNMSHRRWLDVLNAAAQAANWTPKVGSSDVSAANPAKGRGIAVGTHHSPPTHGPTFSYGAAVADIEVDRVSGQVIVTHIYAALDAGLVINPELVENQIVGMSVQTVSRVLKEEIRFSKTNVTSLDWLSYPILRFAEHPEVTAIVVQRLDEKSTGAGEEVMGPVAAAIGNAFFDATGVRIRDFPMTPDRVKLALARRPLG